MSYLAILEQYSGWLRGETEYWMPCPFHQEKKPSMSVNIYSGAYYCFGCQKKGWIHEVVSVVEGISLGDAFEIVGGVGNKTKAKKKKKVLDESILDEFYELDDEGIEYIEGRGIELEIAQEYGLMEGTLLQKGWNGRVMFPIRNLKGELVSVEGRAMSNVVEPRYYKWQGSQSSLGMFGIDKLKRSKIKNVISNKPVVFIVEGVLDCLSLIQCGYPAVAMSCSDLSNRQLYELRNITDCPVLILDGHENSRVEVVQGLKKKFAAHFKEYEVFEILEKDKDPNDLLLENKLKDFMKGIIKILLKDIPF